MDHVELIYFLRKRHSFRKREILKEIEKDLYCATKTVEKCIKVRRNLKPACKTCDAFYVEASYLWRNCIYVFYKRIINLQHKVCVTFANFGNGKSVQLNLFFSFWKTYAWKLKQAENTSRSIQLVFLAGKLR